MALKTSPLFGMLNQKMNWLTQRQRVVAQNIANADTPRYQARDLEALDFRSQLSRRRIKVRMSQTSPMHISSPHDPATQFSLQRSRRTYESAPMRNNVIVEEQMMKLAHTQSDYQLATSTYAKFNSMYKAAIGKSGR